MCFFVCCATSSHLTRVQCCKCLRLKDHTCDPSGLDQGPESSGCSTTFVLPSHYVCLSAPVRQSCHHRVERKVPVSRTKLSFHPHLVTFACALWRQPGMSRPVIQLHPSRRLTGYKPNASRSSAFFGDPDEQAMHMGVAELLGWSSIPPVLDDELNRRGSGNRRHGGSNQMCRVEQDNRHDMRTKQPRRTHHLENEPQGTARATASYKFDVLD